jgi:hypothetical protein
MSSTARPLGHKKYENSERRERACVRCDQPLISEWAGHRLCHKCREANGHAVYEAPRGQLRGVRMRRSL